MKYMWHDLSFALHFPILCLFSLKYIMYYFSFLCRTLFVYHVITDCVRFSPHGLFFCLHIPLVVYPHNIITKQPFNPTQPTHCSCFSSASHPMQLQPTFIAWFFFLNLKIHLTCEMWTIQSDICSIQSGRYCLYRLDVKIII